jgi:hypothetical protein
MAQATCKTVTVERVVKEEQKVCALELTGEEVYVLYGVLGCIMGDPVKTPRGAADRIQLALQNLMSQEAMSMAYSVLEGEIEYKGPLPYLKKSVLK